MRDVLVHLPTFRIVRSEAFWRIGVIVLGNAPHLLIRWSNSPKPIKPEFKSSVLSATKVIREVILHFYRIVMIFL